MQRRDITLNRVIDGDTVDVDIHLGFNVTLSNQRIRLSGIDTPEIHSSDQDEKHYGNLAKTAASIWIQTHPGSQLLYNADNYHDKFGRILGDLAPPHNASDSESLCEYLVRKHHAVRYEGQNKEEIKEQHLKNRALIDQS